MSLTIQPDLLRPEHFPVEFGRYRLLGLLGEGGMARVFRAELQGEEGFRKPTAIKVIHAAIAARGEALRRSLINEARTGGLLHHPNIVDTYDYGEVQGLPYIAMEYVRGVGLDVVLEERGAIPPALALEIGAQICAGLDHAHDLEVDGVPAVIVHRDLKPSNIILSRDGLTKVMDFGIAKATTNAYSTTETGTTKGTPAYMSPEQASGHDLDRRSDVFAVGALLFEMVTGERFFQGDTLMSLLMSVVKVEELIADEARMAPLDVAVPGLADVVRRCLRQRREDRWDSAGDVEAALKDLGRQLPMGTPLRRFARSFTLQTPTQIPSEPVSPTAPMPQGVDPTLWQKEQPDEEAPGLPWALLFAGFGVTVLVAGILFALWGWGGGPGTEQEREPTPLAVLEPAEAASAQTSIEPVAPLNEPAGSLVEPVTPLATSRTDARPGSTAPPPHPVVREQPVLRQQPTPAPAAAVRFGVRTATAREVERERDGAVVRFVVRLDAADPADEVTVHFNPPKARWVERPMRHVGGDRWVVNVNFPRKSLGKTYWYVVAKPADGGSAERWGTEQRPKKLVLGRD